MKRILLFTVVLFALSSCGGNGSTTTTSQSQLSDGVNLSEREEYRYNKALADVEAIEALLQADEQSAEGVAKLQQRAKALNYEYNAEGMNAATVEHCEQLRQRLEAVRDFNVSRRATLNGARVVWTSDALALTRGLGGGRDAQLADGAFLLAKFGVPYTMRSNAKGPVLLMGNIVSSLSDAEISKMLSGAAIVDAPAADELVKRGFGREIGVDVEIAKGRLPVIREEILPAAGLKRRGKEVNAFYIFSAGTEGTVRTFATLKPHNGTEVWSRFYGVGGVEVTPSLTVAKNARGGRVAVVATSLVGNRSSGLFNLRKQEMWRNLLCRIAPDAIDVVALDAPGIWVLTSVSEDGREMMVMVNNLSGDVRDNVSFALSKQWAGATVSRIGADGCKEKGERVSSRWTPNTIFSQMRPEFYLFSR
jgi:hypothetical protein